MKNLDKDILKDASELKEMPFSTPEGYFEGLKKELKAIPGQQGAPVKVFRRKKFVWAASIAAAIAILVTVCTTIFDRQQRYEDFYASADILTNEDIIEYLIYTGTEIEDLEQY